jgi:hypothetical protein
LGIAGAFLGGEARRSLSSGLADMSLMQVNENNGYRQHGKRLAPRLIRQAAVQPSP